MVLTLGIMLWDPLQNNCGLLLQFSKLRPISYWNLAKLQLTELYDRVFGGNGGQIFSGRIPSVVYIVNCNGHYIRTYYTYQHINYVRSKLYYVPNWRLTTEFSDFWCLGKNKMPTNFYTQQQQKTGRIILWIVIITY